MKGRKTFSIVEYGHIYCRDDYASDEVEASLNRIYLPLNAFNNLKDFVAENLDETIEVDKSFSVHKRKGKYFIKVRNYVGVIETKDGTNIEILPKIYRGATSDEDQDPETALKETRAIFLKMLKRLKDSPFIGIDNAHLRSCRFPILEVFITTFLHELDKLVKEGIKRQYVNVQRNQKFLKGRLLFAQNLQQNIVHPERFFIAFDIFDANIPQNRLVKSTLLKLAGASRSVRNQNLIRQYTFTFEEIPSSGNIVNDFSISDGQQSRLFTAYAQLLKWARVFLLNESFTNFRGHHHNKAILFPMERIFEDYVSYGFRRFVTDFEVSTQDKTHHLVQSHKDSKKFALRPDIVLRDRESRTSTVIDCKWKILDSDGSRYNYNISQADMYQLYAYGKKYKRYRCERLLLIYPMQKGFQEALPVFYYELDGERVLPLEVVPFDLSLDLEIAVLNISDKSILFLS